MSVFAFATTTYTINASDSEPRTQSVTYDQRKRFALATAQTITHIDHSLNRTYQRCERLPSTIIKRRKRQRIKSSVQRTVGETTNTNDARNDTNRPLRLLAIRLRQSDSIAFRRLASLTGGHARHANERRDQMRRQPQRSECQRRQSDRHQQSLTGERTQLPSHTKLCVSKPCLIMLTHTNL